MLVWKLPAKKEKMVHIPKNASNNKKVKWSKKDKQELVAEFSDCIMKNVS